MPNSTIELTGDESGLRRSLNNAERASLEFRSTLRSLNGSNLNEVSQSANNASSSLERAERSSEGLFSSLKTGAIVVTGLNQGFSLIGRGIDLGRESFERFLRKTEDGDELWEQLERRLWEAKGLFAELVLGTDDVEAGFEAMMEMTSLAVGVGRELVQMVQLEEGQLTSLVRNGLVLLVDGIGTAVQVYGALRQAQTYVSIGFDLMVTSVGVARDALVGLVEYIAGSVLEGFSAILGGIENLASGAASFGGRLNPMRNQLNGLSDTIGDFRADIDGLSSDLRSSASSSFESMDDRMEGFNDRTERATEEINDLRNSTNDSVDRFRALADSVRDGTFEFESFNGTIGGSGGTTEELDRLGDALERVRDLVAERRAQRESDRQIELDAIARYVELINLQREFLTSGQANRPGASAAAMFREHEEALQSIRDAQEEMAAMEADRILERRFERINKGIGIVGGGFSELINGWVEAEEEGSKLIRNTIADALLAKGTEALLSAPIVAFDITKGGPPAAAGLAGAGAAAIAGASAIRQPGGSGGGAVGAGLAAPSGGGSSVQSFTTNNSQALNVYGNVVGDPRQLASLADDMDRAQQQYGGV